MLIQGGIVFYNGEFVQKDIRIEQEVFTEIAPCNSLKPKQQEEVLKADGLYVLPGLVDVHSHGRVGEDFNFAGQEALQKMCNSYAECGVTSVLGTTMTNEPGAIATAMEQIGMYSETSHSGAHLLGIHMEGPFLGKEKKGAHDEQYLRPIDAAWFESMQKLSKNSIRIVSLDPDLDGSEDFIEKCKQEGVVASLAHTSCDYETAKCAAKAGSDHVTHLFNAMNPLLHRAPGLVGAAFDFDLYMEMICDGIHLHPAIIRMMFAMKPEKILLISDSMQAAGLPDGVYSLGGLDVFVENKKATLKDGTIAGSTTDVYTAMVNVIKFGVPKEQAVLSASYLPAKSIGLEHTVGSIEVGASADFLLAETDFKLVKVYVNGKKYK